MAHQIVFVELRTNNFPKAKEFYSKLLGWKGDNIQLENGIYLMIKNAGATADMGTGIVKNHAPKGTPSHWTPYVGVKDIRAMTAKAKKLGAKIFKDVTKEPWGLVSTIIDPTGAYLSFWQEE